VIFAVEVEFVGETPLELEVEELACCFPGGGASIFTAWLTFGVGGVEAFVTVVAVEEMELLEAVGDAMEEGAAVVVDVVDEEEFGMAELLL
jgi:hypothetical protein